MARSNRRLPGTSCGCTRQSDKPNAACFIKRQQLANGFAGCTRPYGYGPFPYSTNSLHCGCQQIQDNPSFLDINGKQLGEVFYQQDGRFLLLAQGDTAIDIPGGGNIQSNQWYSLSVEINLSTKKINSLGRHSSEQPHLL